MELLPGSKNKAVGELLSQVLSTNPVEFNSAINSNFSSDVVYSGHGIKFEGASNLKHSAWLFNSLVRESATFDVDDIEWSDESNLAKVQTLRYLKLRFLPIFGVAIPVETRLLFNADGKESKLYVTKFEDDWVLEKLLSASPSQVKRAYESTLTPLTTFLFLTLSNILFAVYARATSSKRQYIDTSVDALGQRAKKSLPNQVAANVNSGFSKGEKLAQGWGTTIIKTANSVSYPFLSTVERISQRAVSAAPISLPYPYIYEAHSCPPGLVSKKKSAGSKKPVASKSTATASNKSATKEEAAKEKPAAVQVGPSLDEGDQGKTVEIPARVNVESKEEPAAAKPLQTGPSLYDQLRKEGELPQQQQKDKLAPPATGNGHAGASSEEEEHHPMSHGGEAPKKKKSGSKKKKGGVSHVQPPSFKDGLHQAEEHDAQVHHHAD